MNSLCRVAIVAGAIVFTAAHAHALVVCAKDDGTGQPKPKSKLSLQTACTPGKQVAIGIAVSGTVGTNAKLEVYGANLQVDSGALATDAPPNGLGNVVVGYNEATLSQLHTGSHNIIVGTENQYTSYGGIVAGSQNAISGPFASITGGKLNLASGSFASVSGGDSNTASATFSWAAGGTENTASGLASAVSGGRDNTADGGDLMLLTGGNSSICGGSYNMADGDNAAVGGGTSNVASGPNSSVSGGDTNQASGYASTVSGGDVCGALGLDATVGGGFGVQATSDYAWHAARSGSYPTATLY